MFHVSITLFEKKFSSDIQAGWLGFQVQWIRCAPGHSD
jgi:hypothetical protein